METRHDESRVSSRGVGVGRGGARRGPGGHRGEVSGAEDDDESVEGGVGM